MTRTPVISVVVPVFNREVPLARALDSVLAQTHPDFDCVVVDNASTDGTLAVALDYSARDPRMRVVRGETNVGPVRNWLRGVKATSSQLVKLLFSDDWLEPRCLEVALRAFEAHPEIGFVYFGSRLEGGSGGARRREGLEPSRDFLWRSFVSHRDVPLTPTAAVFRRRDVLTALEMPLSSVRGFDYLGTGVGHDQAMYLEAARRHEAVYYIDEPRVNFGAGPDSLTISLNARRPGFLWWGYLHAQLAFLKRHPAPSSRTLVLRGAVRWHLLKVFLRHRLAPTILPRPFFGRHTS